VRGLALVKKSAAIANCRVGHLPQEVSDAIVVACDEICTGHLHDQFVVDMIQGGAGTSTNMNANEVIANRAQELLGHPRGSYNIVHPNDHVNKSQSTNDAYPSAAKIAIVLEHAKLVKELQLTIKSFRAKGDEFASVLKMGRTQLQDAVPMTLGQEFNAFASTLASDMGILQTIHERFYTVNMGGTAIGTGIAGSRKYTDAVVVAMREVTGMPIQLAPDLVEAGSSVGTMLTYSGILRRVAVKISKICNDLRLLSSGPRCGFNEINLPAMAPGSSIMPGKINPVIPEVMNQVAYQVIGNDVTVTMCAEAGQLQLNVMEPTIIFNLFQSLDILTRGFRTLRESCIDGITANPERCAELVNGSIGIVTALLPVIGYKAASECAKKALAENRGVAEVIVAEGHLKAEQVKKLMAPELMSSMPSGGSPKARGA